MGRKQKRKPRWQKAYDKHRRDFLQFVLATWGAVLAWGLGRYFPTPTPVSIVQPPITGTGNVTLDPLVAGEPHHYTLIADPMRLTWTGCEVEMRVGGAPTA